MRSRRTGPAGDYDPDGRAGPAAQGDASADGQRHRPHYSGEPAPGWGAKVTSVTELVGMEGDMVVLQEIFAYQQQGVDADGRAHGRFVGTGVRRSSWTGWRPRDSTWLRNYLASGCFCETPDSPRRPLPQADQPADSAQPSGLRRAGAGRVPQKGRSQSVDVGQGSRPARSDA